MSKEEQIALELTRITGATNSGRQCTIDNYKRYLKELKEEKEESNLDATKLQKEIESKNLEANFNEKMRALKENINPDMLANVELNEKTSRKMIANLVVENADMQRKIIKAMEHLKIKQARLINEKDYVITDLDLDEIMQDLESKGE